MGHGQGYKLPHDFRPERGKRGKEVGEKIHTRNHNVVINKGIEKIISSGHMTNDVAS